VGGWFWGYILAPIVGASIAAVFFKYVLEPINEKKNHNSSFELNKKKTTICV
jgi:phosphate/sulfate permease